MVFEGIFSGKSVKSGRNEKKYGAHDCACEKYTKKQEKFQLYMFKKPVLHFCGIKLQKMVDSGVLLCYSKVNSFVKKALFGEKCRFLDEAAKHIKNRSKNTPSL